MNQRIFLRMAGLTAMIAAATLAFGCRADRAPSLAEV